MVDSIYDKTATELLVHLARKDLSSAELVGACLDRIASINPRINAVCTINPDAVADARASDQRRRAGEAVRPLEGVPFVAKDNLDTAGLRTTYGSKLFADNVPTEDSVCVERMKRAGAVLVAKVNTPEFAHDINTSNPVFGTTRNPHDLRRSVGGSSGGTAAAIASGMVPIGLGTDLGGSIRIPAAMCGIFGHRPTPGRVPVYPADFGWDTLVEHVHGPMARSVADLGLMLNVLAGPDDRDPSSLPAQAIDYAAAGRVASERLKQRKLVYLHDFGGLLPLEPEVGALTRAAAFSFEALGCRVEEKLFDASDLATIVAGTRAFGMIARYAARVESSRQLLTQHLLNQVDDALKLDVRAITDAERLRTRYWHRVRALLEHYDYIVAPSIGAPAYLLDQPLPTTIAGAPVANYRNAYRYTYAFSIVGLPVTAVPCGMTREGLPIGLQIVARRLADHSALEAAAAYAQAYPQHAVQPGRLALLGDTRDAQ